LSESGFPEYGGSLPSPDLRGFAKKGQKPLVLVDDQGHVIAERYTSAGAWNRTA
jgi:hypothetical protein